MRTDHFESLETLVPRILPQVMPCPRSMVVDALQNLAMDFCKETGAWAAVLREDVVAGDSRISITDAPRDSVLSGVKALYIGGAEQNKADYIVSPYDIVLRFVPQQNAVAAIDGTLRPTRTAERLPAAILDEWGDILTYGALAKLKSMSGVNIGWTDMNGATINLDLYSEGCARVRTRMFRNRLGGGSIYLTSGE